MLSNEEIKRLATKDQTTEINTVREYIQHVFLNYLYTKNKSQDLLFKGGTALRIVYGSPRFSEDMDFTIKKITESEIRQLIEDTLHDLEKEGFEIVSVNYNKTSGGWIIPLETRVSSWPVHIELNLSSRNTKSEGEFQLISCSYTPPYSVNVLKEESLVAEKIDALLNRRKPRDYYDLYFLLRSNLSRKPLVEKKNLLIKTANSIDNTKIRSELKAFLPASHWSTVANLKEKIKKELDRL